MNRGNMIDESFNKVCYVDFSGAISALIEVQSCLQ